MPSLPNCCKQQVEVLIPVNIFIENSETNVYEYAKVRDFTASYSTSNLLNNLSQVVGDVKYDIKTIATLGGVNANFTAVYQFSNHNDQYFAYVSGIRQYRFVSGGQVEVAYENAVVTSLVKNGLQVSNATVEFSVVPDRQLLSVFSF
jgi:hypothetical protein